MSRLSIDLIKQRNKNSGGHFFDENTIKLFKRKIESPPDINGVFITSEQYGDHSTRIFRLRKYNPETYSIETISEDLKSLESARYQEN